MPPEGPEALAAVGDSYRWGGQEKGRKRKGERREGERETEPESQTRPRGTCRKRNRRRVSSG